MHRQSGIAIHAVRRLDHVVLSVAADSVLRSEERGQLKLRMVVQLIRRMLKAVVH